MDWPPFAARAAVLRMTIDESQVVRLEEIGGPRLVVSLIDIVLQELPARVAGMRAALLVQDRQTLGAAAHSVVSGTGHFGAFGLSDLARETELASAAGDWLLLADAVARIEAHTDDFLAFLARERARRVPA
jgi:hypothetical protein